MTTEVETKMVDELRRIVADLDLSDLQKTQLQSAHEKAEDWTEEIREEDPDVTRADLIKKLEAARDQIREYVVKFLTPEELVEWDAEVSKTMTSLGYSMDTSTGCAG